MARKNVPLLTGAISGIIGNALVEENGQITLLNFNEVYRELLKDTWLSAFSYYYQRQPEPHVIMLPKAAPNPADASSNVLVEAAEALVRSGIPREQADKAVTNLILSGFMIRHVGKDAPATA